MSRTEYEQLEFQRRNPHLFTSFDQYVNPDGSIITFDQVTRRNKEALDKLQQHHRLEFGGNHPDFCMKGSEKDVCKIIDFIQEEMDVVRASFIRHYRYVREREFYRRKYVREREFYRRKEAEL